ncbi:MAG: cyclic pyranopterin phosphate synthase [Thermoproteota archaeon]|jgi:cyclic pyranopterin phosphate synthase
MTLISDITGRQFKKLRLSLLENCNMRCLYCMPNNVKFKAEDNLVSYKDFSLIAKNLVEYGVEEIRLTGGEPLLYKDIEKLVFELDKLNLKKLGLTTNAINLEKYLSSFAKTKLKFLNISLDSLNKENFKKITGSNKFDEIIHSILKAKEMGFEIKLNTVLLKGLNTHEIQDFIEFSAKYQIEVRFLELMKIGVAIDYYETHFIKASDIILEINKDNSLKFIHMPKDSTSFNYLVTLKNNKNTANIGFIASESQPFCEGCSRLRLGSDARLRPCLMINEGPSLKDVPIEKYQEILQELIGKKPLTRIKEIRQPMHEIGG